ncbi:hypothetical protein DYJ31_07725 [Parvimonas micra]|uniref:hypothetical protein n=1 Tax=Parvimonas micra TaxID=33033 RepID=UPI000E46AEFF|nr:hypothetical protein [Parvimonas micra]AXU11154.1 hypothetical protein DYJ31_07725 [Parvimonas micra]
MNREEALKIIEENRIFYRDYKKEQFDEALEYLKQPIKISDFLEMQEGVIYTDGTAYYKIQNNSIFYKTKGKIQQVWTLSGYNDYLNVYNKFRELEKVEGKRNNLILKKGYIKLFDLQDNEKYLTVDTKDGTIFNSKYATDNSKYQAQFTLEEIEEIKRNYNIDLCIYDIVEVQD